MKLWIPQLAASEVPALVTLGVKVAAAVAAAEDAVKAYVTLEQQHAYFREAGDRKKFFDHLNATRKETYGALAKLPYLHPDLPSNFASLFFLRGPSRDEQEATVESVEKAIASLEQQLTERRAELEVLEAKAEEKAKKAAEREAKKALAAQLAKEAAEAEQAAKAKRAQIADLDL